ncbi:GTPase IMAP family member 4-like [Archocentrus centrarchus]|uniref:GTPase IMAP family member 4-like n=1 Tax=Archocentrus centrarchus TaxID=63155 RepID=UPI0011E9C79F|nr:GTPase IMAP family member 4-like [Archocentrus centrarchus]
MASTRPDVEKLRIILIGKTGAGKTSTMNTFLGRAAVRKNPFVSDRMPCTTQTAEFEGQELVLVDTPGLCHTLIEEAEVLNTITASTFQPDEGPHVFLYVHKWENGFNQHDEKRVQGLKKMFGEASARYVFFLITHVDGAEDKNTVTKFIKKAGFKPENYTVINNRGGKDQKTEQQKQLMDKINQLVKKNKTKNEEFYSKEMFKEHLEQLKAGSQVDAANTKLSSVVEGSLTAVLGEALTQFVLRFTALLAEMIDEKL